MLSIAMQLLDVGDPVFYPHCYAVRSLVYLSSSFVCVQTLEHLHREAWVCHLDLTSTNVMLQAHSSDVWDGVRLIDFGFAQILEEGMSSVPAHLLQAGYWRVVAAALDCLLVCPSTFQALPDAADMRRSKQGNIRSERDCQTSLCLSAEDPPLRANVRYTYVKPSGVTLCCFVCVQVGVSALAAPRPTQGPSASLLPPATPNSAQCLLETAQVTGPSDVSQVSFTAVQCACTCWASSLSEQLVHMSSVRLRVLVVTCRCGRTVSFDAVW